MELDCITDRGPAPDLAGPAPSQGVRYTLVETVSEHYATDGSPRTFYGVVRVRADEKDAFLRSILPDVREPASDESIALTIAPHGRTKPVFARRKLYRYHAQRHPVHVNARVSDVVVLGGDGHTAKGADGAVTFRQFRPETGTVQPGFVRLGVTWKDPPFKVEVPDDAVLGSTGSEISRYCTFRPPQSKGRNIGITGQVLYYVDDNGAIIRQKADDANSEPLKVLESQPQYAPMQSFAITLKMVPRVPVAAHLLRGCVNSTTSMNLPPKIWDETKIPVEVGTVLYLTYENSEPYWTVSGVEVYDVTYHFLWIASGSFPFRGHNAAFCTRSDILDYRRIVFGNYTGSGGSGAFSPTFTLPVTAVGGSQDNRLTAVGHNTYNFADLQHLFRLEGAMTTPYGT